MKSYTEKNMWNMKACMNLLYTFVMNWDNLTSATSVNTVISTSAVATSLSQVCNETDAQLIISKYKKNTMKRKEELHTEAKDNVL
jgi:hypothetical protein